MYFMMCNVFHGNKAESLNCSHRNMDICIVILIWTYVYPYASEYLLDLKGKEKPSEASEDRLKNIYSRRKEDADNN